MNVWSRTRDEDELPDAVVRMYRESLHEDGLDFLRRGPRTADERLAYVQRVHPEAHRTARPAPMSTQLAYLQSGLLDRERHFIGPDRNLYRRNEATVEPLHASIRRGFETAVPGYGSPNLGDGLAEAEISGDSERQMESASGAGSDMPALPTVSASGWHPAYQAGPLHMKEIGYWSQNATPDDAADLDPQLRKDILHRLWWEGDQGRLTDTQHDLGQAVYGGIRWDDDTQMPHSAEMEAEFLRRVLEDPTIVNAEENWHELTTGERRGPLEQIVRHAADVFGFPMPTVDYRSVIGPGIPPRAGGVHRPDQNSITVNSDVTTRAGGLEGPMYAAAHEAVHPLQNYFGHRWSTGDLPADDPNYAAGEWAALTEPFRVSGNSIDPFLYREQLREYWANRFAHRLYEVFDDRFRQSHDLPPRDGP